MPLVSQFLDGLSTASTLFLLGAGFSLSIGLTRFANLSHGSFPVLGAYAAWSIFPALPRTSSSTLLAILAAAILLGLGGVVLEVLLFRRLYRAPLFQQLLGSIGVLLVLNDFALATWGPIPVTLPAIPDRNIRIATALLAGAAVLLLLQFTGWGKRVRAASAATARSRAVETIPAWLATSVAGLAALLAGLAGALSGRAAPSLDLTFLSEAIIVSLVGGFGSVAGAGLAALAIGLLQTTVAHSPGLTLVPGLGILALILLVRPAGLLGRPYAESPFATKPLTIRPAPLSARLLGCFVLLLAAVAPFIATPSWLTIITGLLIALLLAASLHVIAGPGGMPSLGQAAFFGIGAYAAIVLARDGEIGFGATLLLAPLAAGAAALLLGALTVRLPAIGIAIATLATAQALWMFAIGHPGLDLTDRPAWATVPSLYWLTLALSVGGTLCLRRALYAPFGYALRAIRDDPARAAALGLRSYVLRLAAFTLAGTGAGLAGALAALVRGRASATDLSFGTSVDALTMLLLGGFQSISGPIAGALAGTVLHEVLQSAGRAWHVLFGFVLIAAALWLPQGIAGATLRFWRRAL